MNEEIALSVDDHLVKVIGYQIKLDTVDRQLMNCNHPGEETNQLSADHHHPRNGQLIWKFFHEFLLGQ